MSGFSVLGDWGTTRLRLWRLENGVLGDRADGPGIGALDRPPADALRAALAPLVAGGRAERIVLCGMAGARNGLTEAPYTPCPADSAAWLRDARRLELDGAPLRVAAGMACHDPVRQSDDVMRGEETQLFGAMALQPALGRGARLVVLPGTHAKWVWIEDGQVLRLRTCLTGEVFSLLGRSSLMLDSAADHADREAGFAAGLARAQQPGGLLDKVFEARAAQLRHGRSGAWASRFISGLLIGEEIAGMRTDGPFPDNITLIGDPGLTTLYREALAAFGTGGQDLDGEACALAGLRICHDDD